MAETFTVGGLHRLLGDLLSKDPENADAPVCLTLNSADGGRATADLKRVRTLYVSFSSLKARVGLVTLTDDRE